MATTQPSHSEQQSLDAVHERVRAWWAAVLVGQTTEAHPMYGEAVRAHMDGETLVLTGTAASTRDRRVIAREAERLRGQGMARLRNELAVAPATADRRGLLVQMLIAMYANPDQAGIAAGYLEGHALLPARILVLIDCDRADADAGLEQLHAIVPRDYWHECEAALEDGQTLLLLVVDEVDAFKARELLDEETQSLRVLVLPPEPTSALEQAEQVLHRAPPATVTAGKAAGKVPGKPSRATRARRRARDREATLHDD